MQLVGRTLWRLARLGLIVVVGVATLLGTVIGLKPVARNVTDGASSVGSPVALPPLGGISYLYDRYGNLQQSFNRQIRSPVDLDEVPTPVIGAVLAVEDANFYRHGPVDARSILRALQSNVSAGGVEQGGSTITQQVVKKAVTGDKRDLERKLSEARHATTLEHQLTKDEILEYYLNMIYLGNNIYGVQAAAQTYWGKDISELGWAEGALIAALIRSPNGYEPIRHPEAARKQRGIALKRAVETGRLSQVGADFANKVPLPTKLTRTVPPPDYFAEEVRRRLLNKDGSYDGSPEGRALGDTPAERSAALSGGGLRIYTTYDPVMQSEAIGARQATVPGIQADGRVPKGTWLNPATGKEENQWATATVTSVEPATGAVRVLLGGPGYSGDSQVNIATQSFKNPGSSFKAFTLAAAFDRGFVPDDVVNGTSPCPLVPDDPNYIDPTHPTPDVPAFPAHNYGGGAGSVATITSQTLTSSNCGFVRLSQIVGLRNVLDKAQAMGMSNQMWNAPDPLAEHPNTLNPYAIIQAYGGGFGVHSLDMAAAYAAFPNDGLANQAYFIDRIEDSSGDVIWSHKLSPRRVMSSQAARLVTQVLTENVESGTGSGARLSSGQVAAGKTGTSDDAKDLWFVGYTPQLATAVWIGDGGTYESNMFNSGATGGTYAARVWRAFMSSALKNQPHVGFAPADPTRSGISLQLGPKDGMTFVDRYGAAAARPKTDAGQAGGDTPARSSQGSTPTTTAVRPVPTAPEPPVTAYRP
ncbi:MAG TPA: transglycosylase domain-containing protein [Acidimicrobiales bacterium]|nr:transglycosylase domain-containing protein [Acidimicrobiales bacterium]